MNNKEKLVFSYICRKTDIGEYLKALGKGFELIKELAEYKSRTMSATELRDLCLFVKNYNGNIGHKTIDGTTAYYTPFDKDLTICKPITEFSELELKASCQYELLYCSESASQLEKKIRRFPIVKKKISSPLFPNRYERFKHMGEMFNQGYTRFIIYDDDVDKEYTFSCWKERHDYTALVSVIADGTGGGKGYSDHTYKEFVALEKQKYWHRHGLVVIPRRT